MFSTALKLRSASSKVSKASDKISSESNSRKSNNKDSDNGSDVEKAPSRKRRRIAAIKGKLPKFKRRINKKRCAVTLLIVLLLGTIAGVLGYFFAYVKYAEYYEYGILKDAAGRVDHDWVYWNQWVTRGPSWTLLTFPATAQNVVLRNLSVGTRDELGIKLSLTFQYYLRRWDVPNLHEAYRFNITEPILGRVLDSIKEATPRFDSRMFLTERDTVQTELFSALRWRLEGACCLRNCSANNTRPCREGCVERHNCKKTDMGVYVEIKHFYLLGAIFPEVLSQSFLKNVLTNITSQASELKSLSLQEKAKTELMVAIIRLEEERIKLTAETDAKLVMSLAKSNYSSVVRGVRGKALEDLCHRLNITSETVKNSLEFNNILSHGDKVHMNVDYQPMLVRNYRYP